MISDSLLYCAKKLNWIDEINSAYLQIYIDLKTITEQISYAKQIIRVQTTYLNETKSLILWNDVVDYANSVGDLGNGILLIWFGDKLNKGYPAVVVNKLVNYLDQYPVELWTSNDKGFLVEYFYNPK